MTSFSELYRTFGPDVEKITTDLNHVEPWMIDRLINRSMRVAYEAKLETSRIEAERKREERRAYERAYREENRETIIAHRKRHNARIREELRGIRRAHA